MEVLAAWTLALAWVTVLAGNVYAYYECEVDCGDRGARTLFFLLVLLVPGTVVGLRRLIRGALSDRWRLLAKLTAALYGLVALWIVFYYEVAGPLAIVALACWRLGREPR